MKCHQVLTGACNVGDKTFAVGSVEGVSLNTICNASIYSCLCGSHLESLQEGKGEIRYQIRQCSVYACQSLGNLVTMTFFQSF